MRRIVQKLENFVDRCGPGVVVSKEGPNVWIAMRGELWKCACEQVRLATNVEHEAHGIEPPAGRRRLHGPGSAPSGTSSSSTTSSTTTSSSSSSSTPGEELEEPEREVSGEATATVPSNNPPMNQPEVDGGGTAEASGEHGGYGPVRTTLMTLDYGA